MLLSVLVATLAARRDQFAELAGRLHAQAALLPADTVQVLHHTDRGELTTGAKRNLLLARAAGDYACFFDDDDEPSPRYLGGLVDALAGGPDCVSVPGLYATPAGRRPMLMSLRHKGGGPRSVPGVYLRPAGHLNPVRTALARAAGFADMTSGEDCDYAHRLRNLLKTEADADPRAVCYAYKFDPAASATFHGGRPGVAYWNRFGGDFDVTLFADARDCRPAVRVDGRELAADRRVTGRVPLRVWRVEDTVRFASPGNQAGGCRVDDRAVTVEVLDGQGQWRGTHVNRLAVTGAGRCTVAGRDVVLRFARKGVPN